MSETLDMATIAGIDDTRVPSASEGEALAGELARKRQEAVVAMGRRASVLLDPLVLARDAAALLADMLDASLHGVASLMPEGDSIRRHVWKGCSAGEDSPLVAEDTIAVADESLATYVLQVAHPVVVTDLEKDKRFPDSLLRKHGVTSAVAVPLVVQEQAYGSLAVYTRDQKDFQAEDVLFAETIGHLVATAIARKQAEDSLDQQRCLGDSVMQTVGSMVFLLDREGIITGGNKACENATGFSLGDLRQRRVWDVLPIPEEAEQFKGVIEKLKKEPFAVSYESCLLTKHSVKRYVSWACSPVLDDDGNLSSIILTGVDITAQKAAEERAEQAERDAEELRKKNMELREKASELDDEAGVLNALRQSQAGKKAQRRGQPRRAYPYRQKIAPIIGGQLPAKDEFKELQCRDIGAGGFSFYSNSPPESDELVVALGSPPQLTYLTAEIAHLERVSQDGKKMYLIGCAYTGHASY